MNHRLAHLPLIGASLVAVACSQIACVQAPADDDVESSSSSIVGGVVAQDGAWPGTVALYIGSQRACDGTLVADQWVLTAGHCILQPSSPTGGISKVVIGRQVLSGTDGETHTVDHAYRNQGFSRQMDNDLALLHLSTPSSAPKAKVVSASQVASIVAGANVTVVGWGRTSERGAPSDVLREVTLPIMSNDSCATYPHYGNVTDNMICAGLPQGTKDACQGDSGGPLFMKIGGQTVQVGIVSWGIGCARANSPGVYTRVGNYLQWLRTTSGGAIGGATASDAGTGGTGTDQQ